MSAQTLVAIVGVLCAANIVICIFVFASRYYSTQQKAIQCLVVWLLPIVGPVFIYAFLRSQGILDLFDTRAYPDRTQKGVLIEIGNAVHESSSGGAGDGGD